MRPQRWRRVRTVFERAVELDESERSEFLVEACGGDDDLRRAVEGLLDRDGAPDPLLDRDPEGLAAELLPRADAAGSRIGPYRIVRCLGRGGMGQVYLGRRDDGVFRQDVAIKLLRPGMDSEDLLRRFRAERQILAGLGHPNIARLHDGGMTPDGRPYFVMEYLEGAPITEHCDAHRLPVEARLRLFATACAAVEHAHRRGIVHRDLKPGHILVTGGPAPEETTVKLLDFGIAKVLAPEASGVSAARTRTGVLVMTPEYASPEQLRGEEVGPASDVYGLGVVLYQLLAGRHPHRLEGLSLREIERVVCGESPPLPSAAIERPPVGGRRLGSELDDITLMALRREPERRYASAGALADDIRRHLDGRPVRARGDSIAYRVRTTARRHRAALAGVLAAAGLAAGVLGTAWGVRNAPGPTALAAGDVPRLVVLPFDYQGPAGQEYLATGMTEAIGAHLAGLAGVRVIAHSRALEYGGGDRSARAIGEELGVSYVLDGIVRFERPADPGGRVRVIPRLIRTSDEANLWSRAFDQRMENVFAVQSAVAREVAGALRVTLDGSGSPGADAEPPTEDLEAYRYYLRGNDFLRFNEDAARLRLAEVSYERALARDPDFASAWAKLSVVHTFTWHGRFDASNRRLERARAAAENALSHDPGLPESYYALGIYLYQGRRDYDQALRYFERALELRPNYPEALQGIGWVARRQGRLEEALSRFEQLTVLDPLDASHHHSVAFVRQMMREYPEAERAYAAAAERVSDLPLLHATWARMLASWTGSVSRARGRLAEGAAGSVDNDFSRQTAVELELWGGRWNVALDRLRLLDRPVLDSQPYYVPVAQLEAAAWRGLGRPDSARARLEDARRLLEERVHGHPGDHRAHGALGRVYAHLGRSEEAVRAALRGLELMPPERDAVNGPFRMEDLAAVYALTGRPEEAIAQLEALLAIPGFASRESLKLDPTWASLRAHPRFRALVGLGSIRDPSRSDPA